MKTTVIGVIHFKIVRTSMHIDRSEKKNFEQFEDLSVDECKERAKFKKNEKRRILNLLKIIK